MSAKKVKGSGLDFDGERLKALRQALGETQHDLGIRTGMQAAAISNLECGVIKSPRISTIRRLEEALGSSLRVGPGEEEMHGYLKLSLESFLRSPLGKSLKLTAKEKAELAELRWFNPAEKPSELDWADWIRLRRRVREINGG